MKPWTFPIAERANVAAELLASLDASEVENPAEVEAVGPPKSRVERHERLRINGEEDCRADDADWDNPRSSK